MKCRICGSDTVTELGRVEYYESFDSSVYVCEACGCRFTRHDETIYEFLHAHRHSRYGEYWEASSRYKAAFERNDVEAL